jgi:hypothetical protein
MAILMFGAFMFMKWKKKKNAIFDQSPVASINRSSMPSLPPAETYENEKMPDQSQYVTYANLEQDNNPSFRHSIGLWIQNTASRFSAPTTEGDIISIYREDDPMPPPLAFMRSSRVSEYNLENSDNRT